jgi:hypothetical protein
VCMYPHLHGGNLQYFLLQYLQSPILTYYHQLLLVTWHYCMFLPIYSLNLRVTDRGTSPAPRNWQSTWGSRLQPLRWCQLLQGLGCSDGLHCDSCYDSWTVWSLYRRPEPQAVFRGWRWWARRTQPPSPEGFHRSVLNRTWRSTTLAKKNRVRRCFVTLLHINTH